MFQEQLSPVKYSQNIHKKFMIFRIFFSTKLCLDIQGSYFKLFLVIGNYWNWKVWRVQLCEKCPCSEFFWSAFSRIWTEYRGLLCKSACSVQMWENADQQKLWIRTLFTKCSFNTLRKCWFKPRANSELMEECLL